MGNRNRQDGQEKLQAVPKRKIEQEAGRYKKANIELRNMVRNES